MKVKIDIDTKTFVRFGLVTLAFVLGIVAFYYSRHALTLVLIALFVALALNPPVTRIARILPGQHRVAATAIAYLIVVIIIGGITFLVVPPVIQQSSKFAGTVPSLIDQVTRQRGVVDNFVTQYNLQPQVDQAISNAKSQAASTAAQIGNILVGGVGATLNGLLNLLFVLVLAFFMLIEGPSWLSRIWGLYQDPEKLERHRSLVERMYRVITGYVNGQIIIAAIAALGTVVGVLVLSAIFPLPANLAIPLAVIFFIADMVPMIGATIGAIIVVLVLLLNSFWAAIIFAIYCIIYQQIENNFVAPTVQSKTVELSALTILVSVLIGISLLGLLGGVLAIPVAGCIRVLINDHLEHSRKARSAKSKNPIKLIKAKLAKEQA